GIDRRLLDVRVGLPHHALRLDALRPGQRVRHELARTQEGPRNSRLPNLTLTVEVVRGVRVVRLRRLGRNDGEPDDVPHPRGDRRLHEVVVVRMPVRLAEGRHEGEEAIHTVERPPETFLVAQVPRGNLHLRRETSASRIAGQCPYRHLRLDQLPNDLAANGAGRTGDKNHGTSSSSPPGNLGKRLARQATSGRLSVYRANRWREDG